MPHDDLTALLETTRLILQLIPPAAQAITYAHAKITELIQQLTQWVRARRQKADADQGDDQGNDQGDTDAGSTDEHQDPRAKRR